MRLIEQIKFRGRCITLYIIQYLQTISIPVNRSTCEYNKEKEKDNGGFNNIFSTNTTNEISEKQFNKENRKNKFQVL